VFVAYFVLRMIFRHAGWAAAVLVLLNTTLALGAENWLLEVPFAIGVGSVMAFAIVRFGLLTTLATILTFALMNNAPIVLDSASPAFMPGLLVAVVIFVCALTAFRLSLGQRPVFQLSLEE